MASSTSRMMRLRAATRPGTGAAAGGCLEVPGQEDGAADGAGGAVEGDGGGDRGLESGLAVFEGGRGPGGHLGVDLAGEVRAHGDEVVEEGAVMRRGDVFLGGRGGGRRQG